MSAAKTDRAFIERAVKYANPNALRIALYQATRDPEIAAIPAQRVMVGGTEVVVIDEADIERVQKKALDFLEDHAGDPTPEEVSDDFLDELVQMAEARSISDFDLAMRRQLPSFGDIPHRAAWTDENRTPEGFSVAIVGGGLAGVAMAVQLEQLGIPYRLYERRGELGGVWSINHYPDARVDTQSALYQFGFTKRYPWSEHYARQHEVRQYIEDTARDFGVYEHIDLAHDVTAARYDDDRNEWHLTVVVDGDRTIERTASVVVTGSGLFATPKQLRIPGIDRFEGQVAHTTQWNDDIVYQGRRVAVIGNGSTGVQILSRIADDAESVYVCQRTPQWISPRAGYGEPIEEELRWLIDNMPYYWNWEKFVAGMTSTDLREHLLVDDDWVRDGGIVNERNDSMREMLKSYIAQQVGGREDLIEQLIPDYPPMTRRPVVDNGWYQALTRDNVELVSTGISSIDERGVHFVDGRYVEVDLIVAAVGFDTQKYLSPTEYRGRGGKSLEETWAPGGPKAYLGMTVPDFPNLFILYGPNSQPVASGTGLPCWFEIWSRYIGEAIVAMLESGHVAMEVRSEVFDAYNRHIDDEARRLVYLSGDEEVISKNYYVNDHGRLQVVAPFTGEYIYSLSATPNLGDFELIAPVGSDASDHRQPPISRGGAR